MAVPTVYFEVDASELQNEISRLRNVMKPEQFEKAMYGIFSRTGKHVKTILRKDLPHQYNIKSAEVGRAVKNASVSKSGLGVGCSIPVIGARRHIGGGGKGFTAYGHRQGWRSLTSGHYDITAVIYRGKRSKLPDRMKTGYPPFRNIPSKLSGITFTGTGDNFSRMPIEPVMGIAIPQMPMNKSEPEVQEDIKNYMEERIRARLTALLMSGR